jgi:hypothetical protein
VTIIAAPVLGMEGWMTHALVTVGLTEQLSAAGAASVGVELKLTAARVTAQLGGGDARD